MCGMHGLLIALHTSNIASSRTRRHDPETMRARALGTIALSLTACAGGGRDKTDRVVFDPPAIDFGTRATHRVHELPIAIVNGGNVRRSVKTVRFSPTNEAFAAHQSDGGALEGAVLEPAGSIGIVVSFTPTEEGRADTTMVVSFEDLELRLRITASAAPARAAQAHADPAMIVFAGTEIGGDAEQSFTLENLGDVAGVPRVLRSAPPFFVTTPDGRDISAASVPPQGARSLALHFRPQTAGHATGRIQIAFDNGTVNAEIAASGDAIAEGVLACSPASLDFGPVPRGGRASKPLDCIVHGGPYTISSFSLTQDDAIRLAGAPTVGVMITGLALSLDFVASGPALPHMGALRIVSAGGVETSIPIAGVVTPPDPANTDLQIALSWNTGGTLFDLHLTNAGFGCFAPGHDCDFESPHLDWGTMLDEADDPFLETERKAGLAQQIDLGRATPDIYDVYVQYGGAPGLVAAPPTEVTVSYSIRGSSALTMKAMSACGNTWHVGRFDLKSSPPVVMLDDLETDAWRSRASCP
jgi:hypothetical protein